jgi:hypothetical protein
MTISDLFSSIFSYLFNTPILELSFDLVFWVVVFFGFGVPLKWFHENFDGPGWIIFLFNVTLTGVYWGSMFQFYKFLT